MLIILSSLLFTLLLPILSDIFWPLSILSLMYLTLLSFLFIYQPLPTYSLINNFFSMDQISSTLITLTLWISLLIILASHSILHSKNKPLIFQPMISSLSLILIISFLISNFLSFYIIFETSLIPTMLLILRWGYQPERLQASFYLILYTITASLPLLLSLIFLLKINGHLIINFPLPSSKLLYPPLSYLWWIITIIAFLIKAPIYLFHLWLPKAHVEAPIAGSIILAGLLLKLGGYGLLRISVYGPTLMFKLNPFCNSLALWGGVLTSLICLRQNDIKSLIAYSSIGHIALVIIGTSLITNWGWQGALTIIIAHGLCSSCLFFLARITYEATHTRSLFLTKGILSLFPIISLRWFLILAINIAAPPSINLFAEINLITSALWASPWYFFLLAIIRFLSAAYSLFLYTRTNHGAPTMLSNSSQLLSPHNLTTIIFHITPSILLILKPELINSWIWSYSWTTTLNCKLKSVTHTKTSL